MTKTLDFSAPVRRNDPASSHVAAASVQRKVKPQVLRLLDLIRQYPDRTAGELAAAQPLRLGRRQPDGTARRATARLRREDRMTDAEARAQVTAAAERITLRPRAYLERVEDAAREYIRSRDHDTAPGSWAAAEDALRRALGEEVRPS